MEKKVWGTGKSGREHRPASRGEPAMRALPQTNCFSKVTEEGLEKLAAYADMNLYVFLYPPECVSEKEKEKHQHTFLMIHYYFIQLTLDALEDRELAEFLIPVLDRLNKQMVVYTDSLGVLSDILQLKHGIKGGLPPPAPAEEIRGKSERWLQEECEDVLVGHERLRKREERIRKEEMREEENVMFR